MSPLLDVLVPTTIWPIECGRASAAGDWWSIDEESTERMPEKETQIARRLPEQPHASHQSQDIASGGRRMQHIFAGPPPRSLCLQFVESSTYPLPPPTTSAATWRNL